MAAKMLIDFLDHEKVHYINITHEPAFTAQEVAQRAHIPGREMAKTVMVNIDGNLAMVVLPANRKLSLIDLREACGTDQVRFARENEFASAFPDCEIGAMPPFGNLYGMEVYVDDSLLEDEDIAFNSGSHTELTRMHLCDYERLVHPRIVHCAI